MRKKKIYVEGNILIDTPYFRYLNAVASLHLPLEDAKTRSRRFPNRLAP